jgi:PAS domain S-box-containing protein
MDPRRTPLLERMYASTWSTPVALTLVMASVLFLVVFPRLASRRIDALRDEIENVSTPARTASSEVARSVALEVAAARGFLLTGDGQFRASFDEAARAEARATTDLDAHAARLGGEVPGRVAVFREQKGPWRREIEALFEGRITREEYLGRFTVQQQRFESIVDALERTDAAIIAAEDARRVQIRDWTGTEDRLMVVAAVLAVLSAVAAGALTRRLRVLTRRARLRVKEEQELRHLARALSGALTAHDVVQQVVDRAVEEGHATAAFIEQREEQEVTVVAVAGHGAPPAGLRVAYPGSLTQGTINGRDPEIIAAGPLAGAGRAEHLERSCPGCSALVAPLFAEQDVLGALILVRGPRADGFEEADIGYARIVSDLASAALRRVMLLEQTQRERAALKASEEQFRAVAETAQVGIFVIAQDDTIVFANPPVEKIFGYTPAEIIGRPMSMLIPAELRGSHRAGIDRHVATGRRHIAWEGVELPGLHKDGSEVPLEITIGEFIREGKRYFTGMARDITERRRNEQERAGLLLREREARERAEAAIRTREEVLAIVSHDLRNPLNTIAMGATAIRDFPGADTSRYVEMIQRAIQRMNRLIADLMDVVKLEGGQKLALDPGVVELRPMLGELRESFQAQAEPRHQMVLCECADDVPPIVADRDRLHQVLSNLVGNALKFTPEGGRVTVEAKRAEGEVWISVADTGTGIPPEELPRIFDPYWQARRTARLGAGLGLAISRGIVEGHGGRIWVKSKPGEGTTFTFALPIGGPAVVEDEPAPADEKVSRS